MLRSPGHTPQPTSLPPHAFALNEWWMQFYSTFLIQHDVTSSQFWIQLFYQHRCTIILYLIWFKLLFIWSIPSPRTAHRYVTIKSVVSRQTLWIKYLLSALYSSMSFQKKLSWNSVKELFICAKRENWVRGIHRRHTGSEMIIFFLWKMKIEFSNVSVQDSPSDQSNRHLCCGPRWSPAGKKSMETNESGRKRSGFRININFEVLCENQIRCDSYEGSCRNRCRLHRNEISNKPISHNGTSV